MRVVDLYQFAHERQSIYVKKEAGEPAPWTTDPILQTYRFCNLFREQDKVTKWISDNWRTPYANHPDLWFAMVFARHFNNVPFLSSLPDAPLPTSYEPNMELILEAVRVMAERRLRNKEPVFSPAYIVSTAGNKGSKIDHVIDRVLYPLWAKREQVRPRPGDTLNSWHMQLGLFYGMASFMAGQVVADMKYVEPLRSAADWWTFAASGPGSRRGLNRVLGNPVNHPWTEDNWRLALDRLRLALWQHMQQENWPWELLHAQDVQNLLCEFDKYERARLGEGRPKQHYKPEAVQPPR